MDAVGQIEPSSNAVPQSDPVPLEILPQGIACCSGVLVEEVWFEGLHLLEFAFPD